ncbi:uncharacterized protein PAC_00985 [Phialocephala subalpina]|uniref:Heterokaryon incompatibility domain-containing protein n=1 Tax=Phialocephala subalpina TaxID=576137 RepID=A0A1L7WE91_9HELO|nr:uncharacterized protein PAC_00985 [Phialocephala subalpina]
MIWYELGKTISERAPPSIKCDFTRQQLLGSLMNNCWFCRYLYDSVPAATCDQNLSVSVSYNVAHGVHPTKINILDLEVQGTKRFATQRFSLGVSARPDSPASPFVRAPAEHMREICNFDPSTAFNWIECCRFSHTECSGQDLYQLPSRVLDLSNYKSSNVKLSSVGGRTSQPYAALSYSWGKSKPFMTTSSSLKSHQDGMDVSSMPQTYKDAIRVAGDLGVKYLWIDALCIVQDSADDKIEELSRMRYYYENALFVIAASGASAAQEGFLGFHSLQSPHCPSPTLLSNKGDSRVIEVPFYGPDDKEGTIILDSSPKKYQAADEPLNQRAWTYQERLLCARVLVFPSTGGFYLQCNKEEHHDDSIDFGRPLGRSRMFSLSSAWNTLGFDIKDVHNSWLINIRDYSRRSLTVADDKAVAIAGVAEAYHHRFRVHLGNYLAGHWSKYLLESLHWRVVANELKPAPKTARGPSWSWLSVDSTIQLQPTVLFLRKVVSLVEFHSVGVRKATGKLPFGTVQVGCLAIKASVGKACWTPLRQRPFSPSLETEDGRSIEGGVHTHADVAENFPMKQTLIFFVPLCTAGPSSTICGLLLQQVVPSYNDLFRRIGYFEGASQSILRICGETKLICII